MVSSVGIDDPEIRVALVGHGIGEAAHIDDALAVRRNLRVGGKLNLELIHGAKFVRSILRQEVWVGSKNQGCSEKSGDDASFACHGKRASWRGGLTTRMEGCQGDGRLKLGRGAKSLTPKQPQMAGNNTGPERAGGWRQGEGGR